MLAFGVAPCYTSTVRLSCDSALCASICQWLCAGSAPLTLLPERRPHGDGNTAAPGGQRKHAIRHGNGNASGGGNPEDVPQRDICRGDETWPRSSQREEKGNQHGRAL